MYKFPVILDTLAGPSFLREDQVTTILKSHATPETTTTRIHDSNDNPLHIVVCLKLYVHVALLTELHTFSMCERLAVPGIHECDFCDQMVQSTFPRTRSDKLIDGSTVPIVR